MADPNWFYSTLAQSSAAIVGLTGGFFVQRLLVQRSEIARARPEIHSAVKSAFAEIEKFSEELRRVVASLKAVGRDLAAAENAGSARTAINARTELALLTPAGTSATRGTDYQVDTSLVDEFQATATTLTEVHEILPDSFDEFVTLLDQENGLHPAPIWLQKEPRSATLPGQGMSLINWLPHQSDIARSAWRKLDDEIARVASRYVAFESAIVPRSFYALIIVLALFLSLGVVAPMFFLDSGGRMSRDILLATFVPLSLAFVGYVVVELVQLRRMGRLSESSSSD